MRRSAPEKPPSIEALGGDLPVSDYIGGPEDEGLDNEFSECDNLDIRFRGKETPQERARRIYERLHPPGRPVLAACTACTRDCKQRAETDSNMVFVCFDRRPI